jgi:ech hydrogenase subunit F
LLNKLHNVLANLLSRPTARRNPFEPRAASPDAPGHISFDPANCAFCGVCARRCPAAAIAVSRADKEITFEPFRCIICEACVEVCPRKSITTVCAYRSPAYLKPREVYRAGAQTATETDTTGDKKPAA